MYTRGRHRRPDPGSPAGPGTAARGPGGGRSHRQRARCARLRAQCQRTRPAGQPALLAGRRARHARDADGSLWRPGRPRAVRRCPPGRRRPDLDRRCARAGAAPGRGRALPAHGRGGAPARGRAADGHLRRPCQPHAQRVRRGLRRHALCTARHRHPAALRAAARPGGAPVVHARRHPGPASAGRPPRPQRGRGLVHRPRAGRWLAGRRHAGFHGAAGSHQPGRAGAAGAERTAHGLAAAAGRGRPLVRLHA